LKQLEEAEVILPSTVEVIPFQLPYPATKKKDRVYDYDVFLLSDILNNDVVVAAHRDLRHMEKAKGSGQAAGASRLSVFTLCPQSRSSPGALQDRHSPGARLESCRRIVPFLPAGLSKVWCWRFVTVSGEKTWVHEYLFAVGVRGCGM
jgi:hypothetical protein